MKRYKFRARTREGVLRKGLVEASSRSAAAEVLRGQNLIIVELRDQSQGFLEQIQLFDKVKFDDLVNFTRQLSTMISAGLPITDSLSILEIQSNPALGKRLSGVLRSIEGGSTFADALENHPEVFSPVYVALVRAGEAAGVIDTILAKLAVNLEKQRDFRAKTKSAMIYPIIVLIGMTIVGFIMMVFVLPKLTEMYADFEADLPVMTKILIGVSSFVSKTWYLFILMVAGLIYGFISYRKSKTGRLQTDKLFLKMPVWGRIKEMTLMADFSRTLSLLVGAGVSLVDALNIVQGVLDNRMYSDSIGSVAKDVEKGNPLASSLARYEGFPLIVSQMISVGEQTGKVDEILNKLADYFEIESEYAIKNLSTAMEPLIMILLGIGVGFMIVAIVVPIYNLTSAF